MKTTMKVLLLASVSVLLGNFGDKGESNTLHSSARSSTQNLVRVHSSDTLEKLLKTSLIQRYGVFDAVHYSNFYPASDNAGESLSTAFSTTTHQESMVDESDRLKTDGQYLYTSSINTPSVKIFKADNDHASLVAELPIKIPNNDTPLSGLYLRPDKKQLIALVGNNRHNSQNQWFSTNDWSRRKTALVTVDVSSPTAPKQRKTLTLDGQLINSRRIGSMLYLATRHTVAIPKLIEHPKNDHDAILNRQLISNTTLNNLLPKYQVNGSEHDVFDAKKCFFNGTQPSHFSQHSVISVLAINLDEAVPRPRGQCFIGDSETLYASADAIYLATTQSPYANESSHLIYKGSPTTEIHKFSLDGIHIKYAGSASVQGHLGWQQSQKSFRLSEANGILRVLSYVGEQAGSIDSPARLHMLKENDHRQSLDIIATLPNKKRPTPLGKKGEKIYASRFINDRGYLVTFRTTDPLYILDLSNPYDPFIASALDIDGYSGYLHPVGENFLLGIGKDAIAQASTDSDLNPFESAWPQGVKLSLIDISNPTAPIEKETIILGKRGTETAVSMTHHALSTLLKGGTLQVNIPISLHDTAIKNQATTPHPSHYFGWTQDALYRLNININNGKISMLKPIVAKVNNTANGAAHDYNTNWQQDRSAIIEGNTYYLKRDEVFTSTD